MKTFAVVAALALVFVGSAQAWKPTTHLYTASVAIADIMKGHDTVTIDGTSYRVAPQVAASIRNYSADYQAGVIGPDAFADVPMGQGAIHPDDRGDNSTRTYLDPCLKITAAKPPIGGGKGGTPTCASHDRPQGKGASYTWEWIDYVYRSGWAAYNGCNGCADGQRALAFAYGFITHCAGDVWGHTFVNYFGRAVFPAYVDIVKDTTGTNLGIALRHVIVEGYVDKHAPTMTNNQMALDIPTAFVYRTFIASPTAATLGQGVFIHGFNSLKDSLQNDRNRIADKIHSLEHECLVRNPITGSCVLRGTLPQDLPKLALDKLKEAYLDAWIQDIDTGLQAYPSLSLKIAQNLFGKYQADYSAAEDAVGDYFRLHVLSMLGVPDQFGKLAQTIHDVSKWVSDELKYATWDIRKMKQRMFDWLFYEATGLHIDDIEAYVKNPETYIDNKGDPFRFEYSAGNPIHKQIDGAMGLGVDGVTHPDAKWNTEDDSAAFPAVHDTIVLSKLALLNGAGLNAVLAHYGVPAHYTDHPTKPGGVAKVTEPPDDVMRGDWVRCIDCDHQWRQYSIHDRATDTTDWLPIKNELNHQVQTVFQYGEGSFFLWQDCAARQKVFRHLFEGWGTGWGNQPGFPDTVPTGYRAFDACP